MDKDFLVVRKMFQDEVFDCDSIYRMFDDPDCKLDIVCQYKSYQAQLRKVLKRFALKMGEYYIPSSETYPLVDIYWGEINYELFSGAAVPGYETVFENVAFVDLLIFANARPWQVRNIEGFVDFLLRGITRQISYKLQLPCNEVYISTLKYLYDISSYDIQRMLLVKTSEEGLERMFVNPSVVQEIENSELVEFVQMSMKRFLRYHPVKEFIIWEDAQKQEETVQNVVAAVQKLLPNCGYMWVMFATCLLADRDTNHLNTDFWAYYFVSHVNMKLFRRSLIPRNLGELLCTIKEVITNAY